MKPKKIDEYYDYKYYKALEKQMKQSGRYKKKRPNYWKWIKFFIPIILIFSYSYYNGSILHGDNSKSDSKAESNVDANDNNITNDDTKSKDTNHAINNNLNKPENNVVHFNSEDNTKAENNVSKPKEAPKETIASKRKNEVQSMNNFLDDVNSIHSQCSVVINDLVSLINKNDFSSSSKNALNKEMSNLENMNLNSFKGTEFDYMKNRVKERIEIIRNCVDAYISNSSYSKDLYNVINSDINKSNFYVNSYTNDMKKTIKDAGLEYTVMKDGSIQFR